MRKWSRGVGMRDAMRPIRSLFIYPETSNTKYNKELISKCDYTGVLVSKGSPFFPASTLSIWLGDLLVNLMIHTLLLIHFLLYLATSGKPRDSLVEVCSFSAWIENSDWYNNHCLAILTIYLSSYDNMHFSHIPRVSSLHENHHYHFHREQWSLS